MNTLSSILKFLGNTLGADPSTLVTTDKTVIGSINEVGDAWLGLVKTKTVSIDISTGNNTDVTYMYETLPTVVGYVPIGCDIISGSGGASPRLTSIACLNSALSHIMVYTVGTGTASTATVNVRVYYINSNCISAA